MYLIIPIKIVKNVRWDYLGQKEAIIGIILTIMSSYRTQNRIFLTDTEAETVVNLSRVMRKPAFCICKNKGADKLHIICAADQRYIDRTNPLFPENPFSHVAVYMTEVSGAVL